MPQSDYPTGSDYLRSLLFHEQTKFQSEIDLASNNQLMGTSLSVLDRVSTCRGKCRGGDHILESLAGRSFNLGAAGFSLVRLGYYDEARNLTRSLGEIANLLAALCKHPELYPKWVVAADKKDGWKEFTPSAISNKIGECEDLPIPMDKAEYKELCASATHVTAKTVSNSHNDEGNKFVGGIFQEQGLMKTLGQLSVFTAYVALLASHMVGRTDLFSEVMQEFDRYETDEGRT